MDHELDEMHENAFFQGWCPEGPPGNAQGGLIISRPYITNKYQIGNEYFVELI